MKLNKKVIFIFAVISMILLPFVFKIKIFKNFLILITGGIGVWYLKKYLPEIRKKIQIKRDIEVVSFLNISRSSRLVLVKVKGVEMLLSDSAKGISVLKEFNTEEKRVKKDKKLKMYSSDNDSFLFSKYIGMSVILVLVILLSQGSCFASESVNLQMPNSHFIQIFTAVSLLAVSPAIILMMTPFTRIAITLSILRHAIGLNNVPSNQIIAGLSIFITIFIMNKNIEQIKNNAFDPYIKGQIKTEEFLKRSSTVMRDFMLNYVNKNDLQNFVNMAKIENSDTIPFSVLVPAFITSELKTAFKIGVLLFIPFLLVDLIVSSILMSMGMIMIPPAMVSLPIKMLLFVLADGWNLVIAGLYRGFIQ